MNYNDLDQRKLIKLLRRLDRMADRAEEDRKILKRLINKAETAIQAHDVRITQNEADIQAGKDKLVDHEQRISALEGN